MIMQRERYESLDGVRAALSLCEFPLEFSFVRLRVQLEGAGVSIDGYIGLHKQSSV